MPAPRRSFLPSSMAHQLYGPARSYAPGYCPAYAPRLPASVASAPRLRPSSPSPVEAPTSSMRLPISLATAA